MANLLPPFVAGMPCRLSLQERIFVVKVYYQTGNASETVRLFKESYGRLIDRKTVPEIVKRFEETGTVGECKHGRTRDARTAENVELVSGAIGDMAENFSVRKSSAVLNIPKSSVHRILKLDLQMKPYRYSLHQELNEDDPDRRTQFCEQFIEIITREPHALDEIVWTDEAKFCLNGTVNRHNSVYWAEGNQQRVKTLGMNQHGITVWAGISVSGIVGPYFFEDSVNGQNYLEMLRHVVPQINKKIWMQDGAPAHYARIVVSFLNQHFPDGWIGRRGTYLEWPPRSPDMTPCDFFLWGYIKDIVYKGNPQNLQEIRRSITAAFETIPQTMCQRVCREAVEKRIRLCHNESGNHFENKL